MFCAKNQHEQTYLIRCCFPFSFGVFILEKSGVIKNLITVTFYALNTRNNEILQKKNRRIQRITVKRTEDSLICHINFDSQSVSMPLFLACHSHISYSENE